MNLIKRLLCKDSVAYQDRETHRFYTRCCRCGIRWVFHYDFIVSLAGWINHIYYPRGRAET